MPLPRYYIICIIDVPAGNLAAIFGSSACENIRNAKATTLGPRNSPKKSPAFIPGALAKLPSGAEDGSPELV